VNNNRTTAGSGKLYSIVSLMPSSNTSTSSPYSAAAQKLETLLFQRLVKVISTIKQGALHPQRGAVLPVTQRWRTNSPPSRSNGQTEAKAIAPKVMTGSGLLKRQESTFQPVA
jgi:hypothetical protein